MASISATHCLISIFVLIKCWNKNATFWCPPSLFCTFCILPQVGLRIEPHSNDVKSLPSQRQRFPGLGSLMELPIFSRPGKSRHDFLLTCRLSRRTREEERKKFDWNALFPRTQREPNVAKSIFFFQATTSFQQKHHQIVQLCYTEALRQVSAALHRYLASPAKANLQSRTGVWKQLQQFRKFRKKKIFNGDN